MKNNNEKEWTANHKKRYTWLFNKLDLMRDQIKIKFTIDNYLKNIELSFILNTIKNNNNWGDRSKESLFFMVARYLEINDPTNTNIINIKNDGFNIKQQTEEAEGLNILDDKEKINYRDYSYFLNILNNTKKYNFNNIVDHYKYLILILIIKQPPVRTNFYITAKFTTHEPLAEDITNYIYINKELNKIYYVINDDKVSNTKKFKNKNLSYIEVLHDDLKKFILFSFEHYKRTYLFELNGGPIVQNTLLKYLRTITDVEKINFDIIRSSYITHFYKNNKTYKSRDGLALQMRHSQQTASRNYNKELIPVEDVIILKKQIEELKKQLKN